MHFAGCLLGKPCHYEMCHFLSWKARMKSLINVLYLESFLGGLILKGKRRRDGQGKDKGFLILGKDNIFLNSASRGLCFINQLIIYTLKTNMVFTSAPVWGNCLSWLCGQHTLLSTRHTWLEQKPVWCGVVAGSRRSTLREFSERPRNEREVTAHTGKSDTMERRRHLARGEGGGSDETQVRDIRAGR